MLMQSGPARADITSIRAYRDTDAPALGRLLSALGYPIDDGPTMLRRLRQLEQGAPHAVFVAECEGEVAGWVHVTRVFQSASEGYAEVMVLTVDEARQGQGVGRCLLERAERWVIDTLGPMRIRLGSGVHRTEAHGFYAHLGYEKRPGFTFIKHLSAPADDQ